MSGIDLSKLNPWTYTTPTAPTQGMAAPTGATKPPLEPTASTQPWGVPQAASAPSQGGGGGGGGDTSWIPQAYRQYGDSPGQFYRSKTWGGNLVWHPYWGWQKDTTIKQMYRNSPLKFDTSEADIEKWNLKKNLGTQDWKQGFQLAHGITTDQWHQQADERAAWNAKKAGLAGTPTASGATAAQPTGTNFDFGAWLQQFNQPTTQAGTTTGLTSGTGTDRMVYQPFDASGNPITNTTETPVTTAGATSTGDYSMANQGYNTGFQYPNEINQASNVLGEYAATGRPTDWTDWYQQAKGGVQTDVMDQIKQAAEKAGLGGTRWSTPLGRTAQDISSRAAQDLGTQFMGYQNAALENAANRGLTAAQGLTNLGQLRQQMPIDYANASYNMGQGMNQSYNQMLSSLMQEWMRTQPENSPYWNIAQGLTNFLGQTPQTYQPSVCSQILGAGTSLGSAAYSDK